MKKLEMECESGRVIGQCRDCRTPIRFETAPDTPRGYRYLYGCTCPSHEQPGEQLYALCPRCCSPIYGPEQHDADIPPCPRFTCKCPARWEQGWAGCTGVVIWRGTAIAGEMRWFVGGDIGARRPAYATEPLSNCAFVVQGLEQRYPPERLRILSPDYRPPQEDS